MSLQSKLKVKRSDTEATYIQTPSQRAAAQVWLPLSLAKVPALTPCPKAMDGRGENKGERGY